MKLIPRTQVINTPKTFLELSLQTLQEKGKSESFFKVMK
jgi:hypothetical protein